jgi:phosphatidylglycerophosphate synthase
MWEVHVRANKTTREQAMLKPDSYSSLERRFIGPVRAALLQLYAPLLRLLVRLHVSPNAISVLGPLLGLVFIYSVRGDRRFSFFVWFLSVAADGVDGALARYAGCATDFGALFDQVCDHARETLIVVGLTWSGALSPLWGSLYPFVYVAINVILFLGNYYYAPVPLALKSWIVLYPAILLYLLGGRNYLNLAASLSIAMMLYTIVQGLWLLSRVMDAKTGGRDAHT